MKARQYKNQLLIVMLVVGFFVGIVYENIVSKKYGISVDVFQIYFLNQYKQLKIVSQEYLWYVVKARVFMLGSFLIVIRLKWKKTILCVLSTWTGFVSGMLMVASIMELQWKGMLICILGMFPHMIFYVFAYLVLIIYFYRYPKQVWGKAKSVFVILSMGLGIVFETYLNPPLMKWMIGMM